MERPAGLRERKKRATRVALADAALRLCVERGLDGVTVEQVAKAAGVSLRTFFNYFSSKEDAVVAGDVATAEALVAAFACRPAGEPVLDALRDALLATAAAEHLDRDRAAQLQVVRRVPALLPQLVAAYAAQERDLATAIRARTGAEDPYPLLLAAAVMSGLRVVVECWLDGHGELPDLIEIMIARFAAGFGAP